MTPTITTPLNPGNSKTCKNSDGTTPLILQLDIGGTHADPCEGYEITATDAREALHAIHQTVESHLTAIGPALDWREPSPDDFARHQWEHHARWLARWMNAEQFGGASGKSKHPIAFKGNSTHAIVCEPGRLPRQAFRHSARI